ncbi:MAG: GNAT family N-acetyltransferase [Pseudomonadota bacterium]
MITSAPIIETERLTLRGHRMEDFAPYAAVMASDRARYMGGPLDQQRAWAGFCRDVAQWALLGHGAWAVTDRENGLFLGQIGINRHPYFPETELGWLVTASAEGKGIAGEAATAVRDWAWRVLGLATLVSYIHRENAASVALAERLGAARDDHAPACPYADHVVYRHPAPEAA